MPFEIARDSGSDDSSDDDEDHSGSGGGSDDDDDDEDDGSGSSGRAAALERELFDWTDDECDAAGVDAIVAISSPC